MEEQERTISLPGGNALGATIALPEDPLGAVIFAHGTGSGRFSPRNRAVAATLNRAGFATLLMDLLTQDEEGAERHTGHLRFDIEMLAERLEVAIVAMREQLALPIGLFGASTGAAAALIAAAREPNRVQAVVSRGGRPDLAGAALRLVRAPTLLVVGALDGQVVELNAQARRQMAAHVEMMLIEGATHLFEEPGTLERVAELARGWFETYLPSRAGDRSA